MLQKHRNRLKIGLMIFLSVLTVTAQVPSELENAYFTGDLFARSSLDFRKTQRQNIQGVVPKGSRGTVLETRKLRSGSYAVKLKITAIPQDQQNVRGIIKPPEEAWVYFSQEDPWLAFKDKEGSEVQDPELALDAQAKRKGSGLRHPMNSNSPGVTGIPPTSTPADVRRFEAGLCEGCTQPQNMTTAQVENKKELAEFASAALPGPSNFDTETTLRSEEDVQRYSQSEAVQKMISHAMKRKAPRSKRLCYRYVKKALLAGPLVSTYPPGAKAKDAMVDLKNQGMVNLLDDPQWKQKISGPKDAPKGAILVYSHSRKNRAGHIEIKTGDGHEGGYVSDFYQKTPILGNENAGMASRRYQLIGVFVK